MVSRSQVRDPKHFGKLICTAFWLNTADHYPTLNRGETVRGIIAFVLCVMIFALSSAKADDLSLLYNEFRVPTYEVRNLSVSGHEIFHAHKMGDHYRVSSHPSVRIYWVKQMPELSWMLDEDAFLGVHKSENSDLETEYGNRFYAAGRVYLTGYQGVFVKARTNTRYYNDWDDYVSLRAGLGMGRITEVTSVARAIAASREVFSTSTGELSKEAIKDVAEMIDKRRAYREDFRDEWETRFYGDLGELLQSYGASELSFAQALKLREVMFSPVYRISPKLIGWEFAVAYESSLTYDGAFRGSRGWLLTNFKYARPMALNQQFQASSYVWLQLGQTDLRGKGEVSYTIDHSYNWTSYARTVLNLKAPVGETATHRYEISLGTYRGMSNDLWVHGWASVSKEELWTESVNLECDLGFTYYIF